MSRLEKKIDEQTLKIDKQALKIDQIYKIFAIMFAVAPFIMWWVNIISVNIPMFNIFLEMSAGEACFSAVKSIVDFHIAWQTAFAVVAIVIISSFGWEWKQKNISKISP